MRIKRKLPYWMPILLTLFGICFVLLCFSDGAFPASFKSTGIAAVISTVIGVVLTVTVTATLLDKQSQSQKELLDSEAQKDKEIKIFQEKARVYSEFIKQIWAMFDEEITNDKLKKLRAICFQELVFYLNGEQIKNISTCLWKIKPDENKDVTRRAISKITKILEENIDPDIKIQSGQLELLYNSFTVDYKGYPEYLFTTREQKPGTSFWHFNMLGDEQIEAFKNNNWMLSLIEHGEDWRMKRMKEIKPDDVIFLFTRGAGYIGAFRAFRSFRADYKEDTSKNIEFDKQLIILAESDYRQSDNNSRYDIYKGLSDGATLVSTIIVEPIAYNYKGIGLGETEITSETICEITDSSEINSLLKGFAGNFYDNDKQKEIYKSGCGKLNEEKIIQHINSTDFEKILKERGLLN